jgi:hypothetical protein
MVFASRTDASSWMLNVVELSQAGFLVALVVAAVAEVTLKRCLHVQPAPEPLVVEAAVSAAASRALKVVVVVEVSVAVEVMVSVVAATLAPVAIATALEHQAEHLQALALTGETVATEASPVGMTPAAAGAHMTIDQAVAEMAAEMDAMVAETVAETVVGMEDERQDERLDERLDVMDETAGETADVMATVKAAGPEATWNLSAGAKVGIVTGIVTGIGTTTDPATTIAASEATMAATKIPESCVGTEPYGRSFRWVLSFLTLSFSVLSSHRARVSRGIRFTMFDDPRPKSTGVVLRTQTPRMLPVSGVVNSIPSTRAQNHAISFFYQG